MFRHGEISTEVDQRPFVFTLIAFSGSLIAMILLLVFAWGDGLAIFAAILLFIVAAASGAVLLAIVTDQAYIEDDLLVMRYMFKHVQVPIKEIGKAACKDEIYTIYDRKGNTLGTINARLTGIDQILYKLDQSGVRFA